ncbi:MAG: NUDIX domain-containing protein [candidate division NC10 bacterium]|nr:NUDIX domain-containing protein [candidate division NC10 bacterium]
MQIEPDVSKAQVIRPAVSALIRDASGAILLMRRADNGLWGLPGGSVEVGESVTAAIVREVHEETGLAVSVRRLIGLYSDPAFQVVRYPDGRVIHYVNACFECAIEGGSLSTSPETLDLRFFPPDALPSDFVPLHRIRIQDGLADAPAVYIR